MNTGIHLTDSPCHHTCQTRVRACSRINDRPAVAGRALCGVNRPRDGSIRAGEDGADHCVPEGRRKSGTWWLNW